MKWIPFTIAFGAVLLAVFLTSEEDGGEGPDVDFKEAGEGTIFPRLERSETRLWTLEELNRNNGSNANRPLLLSIAGEVYDVGSGEQHYSKDKGYSGFSGRDASRGWVTGEFNTTDIKGMHDLTPEQIKTVLDWRKFYREHEEYRLVGKLVGDYFNEKGEKTEHLLQCEEKYEGALNIENTKASYQKKYLSCNTRHEAAKPTFEVWCDDSYHGVGTLPYYLRFVLKSKPQSPDYRCACLTKETLAALEDDAVVQLTALPYPECNGKQHCYRPKGSRNPKFPDEVEVKRKIIEPPVKPPSQLRREEEERKKKEAEEQK
eukprot:TRINITY_DN21735_c0_g1_i1.p1 TRINITY_DN21735_c0_g1~~TRINITY_DN21735_c0_g1_i1.p1  ORF type:complete len:317 (+),score=78.90 TRINITY_DN21735_c0_g1_i1:82-1032(+)